MKVPTSVNPVTNISRYFPNTVLITHKNKKVRFYDDLVKGKVFVINLMFTECVDICPITTWSLIQVQKALGDRVGRDVFFYSITLDPERDTPDVLRTYAEKFGEKKAGTFSPVSSRILRDSAVSLDYTIRIRLSMLIKLSTVAFLSMATKQPVDGLLSQVLLSPNPLLKLCSR